MRFKLVKECALFFGACLGGGTVTRATLQMTDSFSLCVCLYACLTVDHRKHFLFATLNDANLWHVIYQLQIQKADTKKSE